MRRILLMIRMLTVFEPRFYEGKDVESITQLV